MSGFKDQVDTDIYSVFLDLDYFGEEHTVEGCVIPCVIDDDVFSEDADARLMGLTRTGLVLYAKQTDIARPVEGDLLVIDGRSYTVADCRLDMGVYRIGLTRPTSY